MGTERKPASVDNRLVEAIYQGVLDPGAYLEIVQHIEDGILSRLVDRPPSDTSAAILDSVVAHMRRAEAILELAQIDRHQSLTELLEAQL
jgi:hypothetical protein